jgi:hypothetical protein
MNQMMNQKLVKQTYQGWAGRRAPNGHVVSVDTNGA